jgi:hypothetical protein
MYKSIISVLLFISISFSGIIFGTGLALANTPTQDSRTSSISLIVNYHVRANEITNQQISKLLNFFNELDVTSNNYTEEILKAFSPPNFQEGTLEEVCADNLSSACLNRRLVVELLFLYSSLNLNNESLPDDSTLDSLIQTIGSSTSVDEFLIDQLEIAIRMTQQTVEFYAQILQAYPMHIQNQRIIEELEVLKVNLNSLRNTMSPYSNIFHNVTSAACE